MRGNTEISLIQVNKFPRNFTEISRTHLTVETILVMYDIPYGDYFRVESKWEVFTGVTPNSCRLAVSTGVHFMKKTWWKSNGSFSLQNFNLLGKIETGSMKESEDGFNLWVQLARKEIARQPRNIQFPDPS
jgi:hypothetical protein